MVRTRALCGVSPLLFGLAAAVVLIGCSGAACPTTAPGTIAHPTGATDAVLRMQRGGGLLPPAMRAVQLPQFTLYGDGTVLLVSADVTTGTTGTRPALSRGHFDEAAMQSLLRRAFDTGCLAAARERYENPAIFDAGSTTFVLNAGGIQKVVWVYALSNSIPGPDPAQREAFLRLQGMLSEVVTGDDLADAAPYDPPIYEATMLEVSEAPAEPIAWPWPELPLEAWSTSGNSPYPKAFLDRSQVGKLMEVPNGGNMGVFVTAPDSRVVQIAVRPLLPEETPMPAPV